VGHVILLLDDVGHVILLLDDVEYVMLLDDVGYVILLELLLNALYCTVLYCMLEDFRNMMDSEHPSKK